MLHPPARCSTPRWSARWPIKPDRNGQRCPPVTVFTPVHSSNGVTNSGTNQWHGTVFEFLRNNYFNANNFFATTKDTLHRNQFGGTVGGKIISDKLFFFGGYQGTRESQSTNAANLCVPTAAEALGDFSQQPKTGSCSQSTIAAGKSLVDPVTGADITATRKLPASSLSPQSQALNKLIPLAQADPVSGLIQIALPAINREDQFIGRVDYTISGRQNVFFRAYVTDYFAPAFFQPNNLLLTTTAGNDERVMNYTLGHTFIVSPKIVNTFHGGFARRRDNRGPTAGGINAQAVGVNIFTYVPCGTSALPSRTASLLAAVPAPPATSTRKPRISSTTSIGSMASTNSPSEASTSALPKTATPAISRTVTSASTAVSAASRTATSANRSSTT